MSSIRVFISYSQDSAEHAAKVASLAARLRKARFDCSYDEGGKLSPSEGWPRWMMNQLEEADVVLVVCTKQYNERFRGKAKGVKSGKGADWEGSLITQALYDNRSHNTRFIPVLFDSKDANHIPAPLRATSYYDIGQGSGTTDLIRRLRNGTGADGDGTSSRALDIVGGSRRPKRRRVHRGATLLGISDTSDISEGLTAVVSRYYDDERDVDVPSLVTKVAAALSDHHDRVEKWSREVGFRELGGARQLLKMFIDVDLDITPRSLRIESQPERRSTVGALASHPRSFALLGDPGAGKTTSAKKVCQDLLAPYGEAGVSAPVVVILREMGGTKSLCQQVLRDIGIRRLPSSVDHSASSTDDTRDVARRILTDLVRQLRLTIVFDGLDEVPTQRLRDVVSELHALFQAAEPGRIIVTCRSGEFQYSFPNADVFEICPLTKEQMRQFAEKWLPSKRKAAEFMKAIRSTPYLDSAVRPLMLAHLCVIFLRDRKIPDKPKTVYRKIVRLLLEEWDRERNVVRDSQYASFESDRKQDVLEALAYQLTRRRLGASFTHEQLEDAYQATHLAFDLPSGEALLVAKEIESHTGLLIQAGYGRYEFAHKSVQEYLTAEHIVKFPSIPRKDATVSELPNEFALVVALSASPSRYFAMFAVDELAKAGSDVKQTFLSRLLLERPDFARDALLGLGVLAVAQATPNSERGAPAVHALLRHLCELGQVHSSVQLALDLFERKSATSEHITLLRRRALSNSAGIEVPFSVTVGTGAASAIGLVDGVAE